MKIQAIWLQIQYSPFYLMGLSMGRQYALCLWPEYQLDLPRPRDRLCTLGLFSISNPTLWACCLVRKEKIVQASWSGVSSVYDPALRWDLPRAQDRRHSAWPECPTLTHTNTLLHKYISYFDTPRLSCKSTFLALKHFNTLTLTLNCFSGHQAPDQDRKEKRVLSMHLRVSSELFTTLWWYL